MKKIRVVLFVVAFLMSSAGFAVYGTLTTAPSGECETASACGRCGDGVCVKRCGETAKSCPADCGGSPSAK